MFLEVFYAVLLANIAFNVIMFFTAKLYFEHVFRAWTGEDDA